MNICSSRNIPMQEYYDKDLIDLHCAGDAKISDCSLLNVVIMQDAEIINCKLKSHGLDVFNKIVVGGYGKIEKLHGENARDKIVLSRGGHIVQSDIRQILQINQSAHIALSKLQTVEVVGDLDMYSTEPFYPDSMSLKVCGNLSAIDCWCTNILVSQNANMKFSHIEHLTVHGNASIICSNIQNLQCSRNTIIKAGRIMDLVVMKDFGVNTLKQQEKEGVGAEAAKKEDGLDLTLPLVARPPVLTLEGVFVHNLKFLDGAEAKVILKGGATVSQMTGVEVFYA